MFESDALIVTDMIIWLETSTASKRVSKHFRAILKAHDAIASSDVVSA